MSRSKTLKNFVIKTDHLGLSRYSLSWRYFFLAVSTQINFMGNSLKATCPCGFEGRATIGSSRIEHGIVFRFPHQCKTCQALVNVDMLKASLVCPTCVSDQIKRYGLAIPHLPKPHRNWYQRLFGRKPPEPPQPVAEPDPEDTVSSSYCYRLQTTFVLTAEGNQCPKCDATSLRFERPDMYFD